MNTNKTNSPWPAHRVQFITLCTHEKQTTLGRIYKDKTDSSGSRRYGEWPRRKGCGS